MILFIDYVVATVGAGKAMPASEMAELLEWEKAHINGTVGTTDWPGWVRYLGPPPTLEQSETADTTFVYLMCDTRNGYTKIGSSKRPKYRERALQSEVPQVHLLCSFEVPRKQERILHGMYRNQRVRGEWFNLSETEIRNIKDYLEGHAQAVTGMARPWEMRRTEYGSHS